MVLFVMVHYLTCISLLKKPLLQPIFSFLSLPALACWIILSVASPAHANETLKSFQKTVMALQPIEPPMQIDVGYTFSSTDQKRLNLAKFQGKPVLLNFWATWCTPCIAELESLNRLKHLRSQLEIVAISQDTKKTPEVLGGFLKKYKAADLQVYFEESVSADEFFNIRGLPTSYLIDPNGTILYKIEGDVDWASDTTLRFIDFAFKF